MLAPPGAQDKGFMLRLRISPVLRLTATSATAAT
jgi:hypothetical protein